MKKLICLFLILCLSVSVLSACGGKTTGNDERVIKAISALEEEWKEWFVDMFGEVNDDACVEIIHTKLINVKDTAGEKDSIFVDMEYVVEFVLLAALDETEYTSVISTLNSVWVYKDGTMRVSKSPFVLYRNQNYDFDFSPLIDSVEDLKDMYNRELDID